jgi:hypothetical protein
MEQDPSWNTSTVSACQKSSLQFMETKGSLACLKKSKYLSVRTPATGPVWPRWFQAVRAPRFSWHSAHEGGKVVSLMHRPPLPPGNVPGTHFHQGLSWPQGHGAVGRNISLKNPVTPLGIDPRTVWLVAQCLNLYATPGPNTCQYLI